MRISGDHGSGPWAVYVHRVRTGLGISKAEAARRVGIFRPSWGRWERGDTVPDDAGLIARVADMAGEPVGDALAAAGITAVDAGAGEERDEELRIIRESNAPDRVKKALIDYVHRRRAEQARERIEAIELALKNQQ